MSPAKIVIFQVKHVLKTRFWLFGKSYKREIIANLIQEKDHFFTIFFIIKNI